MFILYHTLFLQHSTVLLHIPTSKRRNFGFADMKQTKGNEIALFTTF